MYKKDDIMKTTLILILLIIVCKSNAQFDEARNRDIALKKELEFEKWNKHSEQKRNGINLSKVRLKELEKANEVRPKKMFFIAKTKSDSSFIQYRSKWTDSDNSYIEITMSYFETPLEAQNYVMEYYVLSSSLPFEKLKKSKDKAETVGDLSFFEGTVFIRDNIVVNIYSEGDFIKKNLRIAKEIDSLLLSQSTSQSRNEVKPLLKKDDNGKISIIEP
jgi:hypothetical protein